MDIGVVIKKYRKEAGMTQEEMANRLGVTTPAVNKWENSNSKPDIELLAPIARLLDISVVTKSELADMMNSFISDDDEKWLMFNAKFSSADEVYESVYRQAKSSIYVVDNYIGLRTLVHLKNSPSGVDIILFSDNVGNNKLHNIEYTDFRKEYPTVKLSIKETGGIFHDRFIVLDYETADERVFLCGASSKDAGARITSIVEDYGIAKYNSVIAEDEVEEAIADLKSRVYELKKIRLIRKREFN